MSSRSLHNFFNDCPMLQAGCWMLPGVVIGALAAAQSVDRLILALAFILLPATTAIYVTLERMNECTPLQGVHSYNPPVFTASHIIFIFTIGYLVGFMVFAVVCQ